MADYTIIKDDNMVYVNGDALPVDCSHLPTYVHAVTWNSKAATPYGEIQFAMDAEGRKMPNLRFHDFEPLRYLVDNWEEAAVARHVEQVRQEAEIAAALAAREHP